MMNLFDNIFYDSYSYSWYKQGMNLFGKNPTPRPISCYQSNGHSRGNYKQKIGHKEKVLTKRRAKNKAARKARRKNRGK